MTDFSAPTGFVVGLAGVQAVVQAAEESVEQVALRGDVPVASEVDDATAEVLFDCSLVVVILAVIPWWHYVWQHYAGAHGDRWR